MSKQIVPATKRELFDALKRSIERAEAAEARAEQLAAQLATAQAALERVTLEKNRLFSIVEKVALIVRSDADDNHLTDLDSLPDNVKALSDDFFSTNQELISVRKELDKHEPIEWPGLTGFQP